MNFYIKNKFILIITLNFLINSIKARKIKLLKFYEYFFKSCICNIKQHLLYFSNMTITKE